MRGPTATTRFLPLNLEAAGGLLHESWRYYRYLGASLPVSLSGALFVEPEEGGGSKVMRNSAPRESWHWPAFTKAWKSWDERARAEFDEARFSRGSESMREGEGKKTKPAQRDLDPSDPCLVP